MKTHTHTHTRRSSKTVKRSSEELQGDGNNGYEIRNMRRDKRKERGSERRMTRKERPKRTEVLKGAERS